MFDLIPMQRGLGAAFLPSQLEGERGLGDIIVVYGMLLCSSDKNKKREGKQSENRKIN